MKRCLALQFFRFFILKHVSAKLLLINLQKRTNNKANFLQKLPNLPNIT